MSGRDPITPSAGVDATVERRPQTDPLEKALDETRLAPASKPISGLDATAIAPDGALAATQMDTPDLARGSGTPLPAQRTTRSIVIGSRIGRFVVTEELGAGGMGVVYAGYDPKLDRKVAIKMLHEGISGSHRARLEREARAMAKLAHPNVVSVYEVGEFKNRLFVAMELVDGKTLRDWLAKTKPSKQQIMKVMLDAGRGLAAAHEAGMVHRDFKPDNVLVGNDGRARVSDFGLVTPVGNDTIDERVGEGAPVAPLSPSALTQVGTIMGTPLYMAPEQHQGESADDRADQFSFCVTLWEALYENTPYTAKSYEALVDNVISGRISPPPKANKGPAWVRAILTRGLSVDPAERYESMNALLSALENDPWVLRKRLALGGAGVAITGVTAVLLFGGDTEDRGAVCQGASAQIENVWTEEVKAGIGAAFANSGVEDASKSWAYASERLEEYGKDWVKFRTQSCEATHVHKEQDEALLRYSMDCFDRRLLGYRSTIELFSSSPNEAVVKNARQAVDSLANMQSCLGRSELENGPKLPEDPTKREQVLALIEEQNDVNNLGLRGEHKEGLAKVGPLAERAIALSYTPVEAEALIAKGGFELTLGDLDSAEKTLRQAASAAARTQNDAMVALVWVRLLDLLVQRGDFDEALNIETVAVTSAERVPNDHYLNARLQNTLGGIYVAKARYEDAFTAYEKALFHIRATGDDEHPALAAAIANLGLAYWYRGNIPEAKKSFEESLAIMLRDLGPDHSQVAYARKNIADLEIQLGNDEVAYVHYLEVLRIWKASLGDDHANLGYAYEQLARLAQRSGDNDKALDYVQKTIKVRKDAMGPDHPINAQSLSVAIEVYLAIGTKETLEQADAAVVEGLAIVEKLGEAGTTNKIYILDSRAKIAEAREDWKAALEDREAVLELRRKAFGDKHTDTAYSFAMVGKLAFQLRDFHKAEAMLVAAQDVYDSMPGYGDADGVGMRRSRAALRLQQGKAHEARALLQEALEKARVGEDTAHMVPVVEFELVKLRSDMGEQEAAIAAAQSLVESLDDEEMEALRAEIQSWMREEK